MCGIYGYLGHIKSGKEKAVVELMKALAICTEVRGTDSTGYMAVDSENITVEKDIVPASTFVSENENMEKVILGGAYIFVGHNRRASIGDVTVDNAHPFLGDNYGLVHNGTFDGSVKMAQRHRVVRSMEGQTDSEALLRCIDKKGIKASFLAKLSDYSLVILDIKKHELIFAKDDRKPMFIFDMRKELGIRVFASTVKIFEEALWLIESEAEVSYFSTRPWNVYTASPEDGEFTRGDDYRDEAFKHYQERKEAEREEHFKKKEEKAKNPSAPKTDARFGRRGYPAPGHFEECTNGKPNCSYKATDGFSCLCCELPEECTSLPKKKSFIGKKLLMF